MPSAVDRLQSHLDTPTPASAVSSTLNAAPGTIRARDMIRSPLPRRADSPGGLTIQPTGFEKARRVKEARLTRQVTSKTMARDHASPIHGYAEDSPGHGREEAENRRSDPVRPDDDATSSHSLQQHYHHAPRRATITTDSEEEVEESYKSNFSANANGLKRAFEEVNQLELPSPQRKLGSVDDYPSRARETFGNLSNAQLDSPTRMSKQATETHGFSVQDKTWQPTRVPQNSQVEPTPRKVTMPTRAAAKTPRATLPPPSTVRVQRQVSAPIVPTTAASRRVVVHSPPRPASEPSEIGDDDSLLSSPPQQARPQSTPAVRPQSAPAMRRGEGPPIADVTGVTDGIISPEKPRRGGLMHQTRAREVDDSHLDVALQRVQDDLEAVREHVDTVNEHFEKDSGIGDSPEPEEDEPFFPDPLASRPTLVSKKELSQYHKKCLESLDRVSTGYQQSLGQLRGLHDHQREMDSRTQAKLLETLEKLGEELSLVKKILRGLVNVFEEMEHEPRRASGASLSKRRSDPGMRRSASPPPRERSPTPDVIELADKLGNHCRHTCDRCRAHVARAAPRAKPQDGFKSFDGPLEEDPHPSAALLRKIAELEANLDWQKGKYHEFWISYKQRDPSTQKASRKALAEHLQHLFKTIEETSDKISQLYTELHQVYGHEDTPGRQQPQQQRRQQLFP